MQGKIVGVGLVVVAFVATAGHAFAQTGNAVTAFVDVSVIPMDRERVLPGQTVVVRGDKIVALGPTKGVTVPDGAVRVDGRGKFLMPGLGDMHVHVAKIGSGDGPILDTTLADAMLLSFVANGVTTVRDMHSGPSHSGNHWIMALRRQIADKQVLGPRIYAAGDTHDTSPAQAAKDVEALKAAGYDFVKVTPYDSTMYDSIATAAHRVGLPIVGHGFIGLIESPNYSMARLFADRWSSTEHLFGYFRYATGTTVFSGEEEAKYPRVADTTIRRIALEAKRAGVWNCPTLAIEELTETNYHDADFDIRFVKMLHDVGAGLLMGTDAFVRLGDNPPNFVRSGFLAHRELELLVDAGLTPFQALQTATTNVAQYLHAEDSTGTVAVGKRADLVLLKANPLQNIRNTTTLAGVMVAGQWLSRSELEARVDSLPPKWVGGEGDFGTPKAQMRLLRNAMWH